MVRNAVGLRAIALLAGALLVGCGPEVGWEQEYACAGQEQSRSYFMDSDPASATQRDYPLTIDFHLRSGSALVKSALVAVDASSADALRFSARSKNFWVNGQFNKGTNQLTVVDERTLDIAGRAQVTRTTGQYVCRPADRPAARVA